MNGFALQDQNDPDIVGIGTLSSWESLVVDAVGNVIDFWNFKRNHGRVWALLYLRGIPMTALQLQDTLGLSKGAASMLTRELEQWNVIRRVRAPNDANWHFIAETDFMRMLRRVISEREAMLVQRVLADLKRAEDLAKRSKDATPEALVRLARIRALASLIDKALRTFIQTSRLDVLSAASVLDIVRRKPR